MDCRNGGKLPCKKERKGKTRRTERAADRQMVREKSIAGEPTENQLPHISI